MSKLSLNIYERYILGGLIDDNVRITALSNLRCHYSIYKNEDGSFKDHRLLVEVKSCLRLLARYNLIYYNYRYRLRYPDNRTIGFLVNRIKKAIIRFEQGKFDEKEHVFCACRIPNGLVLL